MAFIVIAWSGGSLATAAGPGLAASLESPPAAAAALHDQGAALLRQGNPRAAIPKLRAAAELEPLRWKYLDVLLEAYIQTGEYGGRKSLTHERWEHLRKRVGNLLRPTTAKVVEISDMGLLYSRIQMPAAAAQCFQAAIPLYERQNKLGYLGRALDDLAEIYMTAGQYAKAKPLYQKALAIREVKPGPQDPLTLRSLIHLAAVSEALGEYRKAEEYHQRVVSLNRKLSGPESDGTGASLNNLAWVYYKEGEYAKAGPLYRRALAIREKNHGRDDADAAKILSNLSLLYAETNDYAKAAPINQRVLKIFETKLGAANRYTGTSLNNLAEIHASIGDYAEAEILYRRSLRIAEKEFGPNHPETARSLNNLAGLYSSKGDYVKAEMLYRRTLRIWEELLGPDHPDTAIALESLAGIHDRNQNYGQAEALRLRALRITEKAFGTQNIHTARRLNNLAWHYWKMGLHAKAEPLFLRALKIRQEKLGLSHTDTAQSLSNAACVKIDLGQTEAAVVLAQRAMEVENAVLANILAFTDEQQRFAFLTTQRPFSLLATLEAATPMAQAVLTRKGIVLDSLLEDRLPAHAARPLDRKVEKQTRRSLSTSIEQVQASLAGNEALVEFLHYNHYLGNDKWEAQYGAILLSHDHAAKWIPLGSAEVIENSARLYQKSTRGKTDEWTCAKVLQDLYRQLWEPIGRALPGNTTSVVISPDSELNFISFATLLAPSGKFLSQSYSIRYVASGRDLLREFQTSAIPLLLVFANPDFSGEAVREATNSSRNPTNALRSVAMEGSRDMLLPPLPGTTSEAEALNDYGRKAGWQTEVILGTDATESRLGRVSSPRILHLATHGFFLSAPADNPANARKVEEKKRTGSLELNPENRRILNNPMRRSGLALTGAQHTLDAWAKGHFPPGRNDGIMTAEEVGGLNLKGTWLVVLSACDTGSGEARGGEGVMGLRRGFIQAGAQNLLMTLWPISDEMTVQIMLDFYEHAFKSGNAPQALAEVQRDWLVKLREERGLLAAVRLAGPFILNSQGKSQ